MSSYDSSNVFAKVLRGEVPCKKVYEDEIALAFYDVNPKAPIHVLVIPKGPFAGYEDFINSATSEEISGFQRAVGKTISALGVSAGGFRLLVNNGVNAHQEVPHYHVHILGGGDLGAMPAETTAT